jgi:hypothetical protein
MNRKTFFNTLNASDDRDRPTSGCRSLIGRFVRDCLLTEVAAFALTIGVGWLIGWRTIDPYANGLIWAGLIVIVIGLASVLGAAGVMYDFRYYLNPKSTPVSVGVRGEQDSRDVLQSVGFAGVMGVAGLTIILAGLIILSIAG